jgi:hypothetical protein
LKPLRRGIEKPFRLGSETPSTFRRRPDRDATATTAAPASPANAAPPAISGTFTFSTTLPTPSAVFCAALLAVSFADRAVLRALEPALRAREDVLRADPREDTLRADPLEDVRADPEGFERDLLVVRVERLESAPFREALPARVDLLLDGPSRDVLRLRVDVLRLRVPEDLDDVLRALPVLVCAMPLSPAEIRSEPIRYPSLRDLIDSSCERGSRRISCKRRRGRQSHRGPSGYREDMKSLLIAVTQRLQGERPTAIRAFAGAAVAGGVTGAAVYKLLRG